MLTVLIARFCRLSDLTRHLIFTLTALQIILKNFIKHKRIVITHCADMNFHSPAKLMIFFTKSNNNRGLPKTILFNLNDKDNIVLAAMLGNFQSSDAESKIQFGPAWWFLDTMDGMTAQMKSLANLGVLGKFVGMETDSRSFTSYGRHEYFRRIMCNLIGSWVEKGMYAYDEDILKEIVEGISYNNAIKYFNFVSLNRSNGEVLLPRYILRRLPKHGKNERF